MSASSVPADSRPDAGSAHHPWRRRLLWGAGGLVGLAALVIGSSALFVRSEAGAQWLIERGLGAYDEGVAGSIAYAATEGNFESGVSLRDLEVRDREGRLLIAAKRVGWAISPWRAMRGDVDIRDFVVEQSTIVLPSDGEPGFEDVRPPPREDREPEARREGEGPAGNLALSMHLGPVELRQRTAPDQELASTELLMELRRFDLEAKSVEGKARAELGLSMALPAFEGLDIEALDLVATYEAPLAKIESLKLDSSWGQIELSTLTVDRSHGWAELAKSEVQVPPALLQERLGLALPEAPRFDAKGRIAMDGTDFRVGADLGPAGKLDLTLRSTPFPKVSAGASLQGELQLDRIFAGTGLGRAKAGLEIMAAPRESGAWGLDASFGCEGCEGVPRPAVDGETEAYPAGPVRAKVALTAGDKREDSDAAWAGEIEANFAGVRVEGSVRALPRAAGEEAPDAEGEGDEASDADRAPRFALDLDLRSEDWRRFALMLARYGFDSPIRGPGQVSLRCEGQIGSPQLWCTQAFRPTDDAPLPPEASARDGGLVSFMAAQPARGESPVLREALEALEARLSGPAPSTEEERAPAVEPAAP